MLWWQQLFSDYCCTPVSTSEHGDVSVIRPQSRLWSWDCVVTCSWLCWVGSSWPHCPCSWCPLSPAVHTCSNQMTRARCSESRSWDQWQEHDEYHLWKTNSVSGSTADIHHWWISLSFTSATTIDNYWWLIFKYWYIMMIDNWWSIVDDWILMIYW